MEKNLLNLHRSFLIIFGCKIFESEKVTPNCSLLNIYMEYAWSAWLQTTLLPVQQDYQYQKAMILGSESEKDNCFVLPDHLTGLSAWLRPS